jgi:AcrR family transcriptional regulator
MTGDRKIARHEQGAGQPDSGDARSNTRLHVLENQHMRLLEAVAEVVAERGLRRATAAEVARRASVSRTAFAQHFDDVDSCFLALLDWMLERGVATTADAFQDEPSWDDAVVAGLEALLVFLDSEPICARACFLESMTGLPSGFQSRAERLGQLGRLVDATARQQLALERQPPATMPEAVVASVVGILRRRLLSGEAPPFVGLLDQLTEVVVAPYLGPSAARQAAGKAGKRAQLLLEKRAAARACEEFELPPMLRHASSHRLRSCLQYVADHPNASNQAIGENIGVSHSGQLSMLLARLHDAGVLDKNCGSPGRPNAWRLSPYGDEVARSLFRR